MTVHRYHHNPEHQPAAVQQWSDLPAVTVAEFMDAARQHGGIATFNGGCSVITADQLDAMMADPEWRGEFEA